MKSVQEIAESIVAREGGFVNDPDDASGATKYGVTIKTMRRLGIDLNGDGAVDMCGSLAGRKRVISLSGIILSHHRSRACPDRGTQAFLICM
jgi:hypothetical protein